MSPIDLAKHDDAQEALGKMYRVDRIILHPDHWRRYPNRVALSWIKVKFEKSNANIVPNNKFGVYTFVVEPGIAQHPSCAFLLYVGKVVKQSFQDRFKQYLAESTNKKPRDHILRMLRNWDDNLWFYYAIVDDEKLTTQLEDDLIEAYLPAHNRAFPAHIGQLVRRIFS